MAAADAKTSGGSAWVDGHDRRGTDWPGAALIEQEDVRGAADALEDVVGIGDLRRRDPRLPGPPAR